MRNKFLLTQTLLSSWLWSYRTEGGYDDFLKTLDRKPVQSTRAMLDGNRFENILNSTLNRAGISPDHEWYRPINKLCSTLAGARQQVKLSRDITVDGIDFVCYGVLDFLKAGIIYDTKYSETYMTNKYLDSPQHPMYFYLVPEAYEFQYKICDGKYIYTEIYRPEDTQPIEKTIKYFMTFLERRGLIDIYCQKWQSKY